MLLSKVAQVISHFVKGMSWTIPNEHNEVYLTFDDGPTPQITDWTLNLLSRKNVQATFFCIGKNVMQDQNIYNDIVKQGHSIGNHTMNHVSGWRTSNKNYLSDIIEAGKYIDSDLFRPPYGEISPQQYFQLKEYFRIIMWDHLSEDYSNIGEQKIIKNATHDIRSGSIIVMHDSTKAESNLKKTLEPIVDIILDRGFQPCAIPYNNKPHNFVIESSNSN